MQDKVTHVIKTRKSKIENKLTRVELNPAMIISQCSCSESLGNSWCAFKLLIHEISHLEPLSLTKWSVK